MDTLIHAGTTWSAQTTVEHTKSKFAAFIKKQKKYETAWFLVSLIIEGVFFLPIPALLIFNFGAPVYLLLFTLGLFFANIIAGMSNAGSKMIIYLFAASTVVHLAMLAIFIL